MNRREFSMLAGALGLAPVLGDIAFAQVGDASRVRKDAATSDAGNDLTAYRKGVAVLKKNVNATDYDSWMYWANSHGTPDAIPDAMREVWAQCEHGTTHFLTWHRAYLFFFEVLIREKSGEGSFALPYWNWFGSKQIPAAFLSEQVDGHSNALFHPLRLYRDKTLVSAALGQSEFYGFGSMLEGNPHGTVHTMVGGDMGAAATSARDPLFWLHHCNVDRMWSVWLEQDAKHQNPSDSTWLNKQFVFDVAQTKKQRVSDLVAIGGVMNYAYDSLKPAGGSVTRSIEKAKSPSRSSQWSRCGAGTDSGGSLLTKCALISAAVAGPRSAVSRSGSPAGTPAGSLGREPRSSLAASGDLTRSSAR